MVKARRAADELRREFDELKREVNASQLEPTRELPKLEQEQLLGTTLEKMTMILAANHGRSSAPRLTGGEKG